MTKESLKKEVDGSSLRLTVLGEIDHHSAKGLREEIDALYNRFYRSGKKIDARARMLAAQNGIFWRSIEGSGEDGIVTESDIRRAMRS